MALWKPAVFCCWKYFQSCFQFTHPSMKMVAHIKTRHELNSFAEVGISSCPIISPCKVGPEMWDGESLIRSIPPPTAVCTLVNPDLEDIMHLYYVFVFRSISLSFEIGANEIPKWSIRPLFPSSKSGFGRDLEFVILYQISWTIWTIWWVCVAYRSSSRWLSS